MQRAEAAQAWRRRAVRQAQALAWAGLLCAAHGAAHAHSETEGPHSAVPDAPGYRLGAALAWVAGDAASAWPAARLPGVPGTGSAATDQRAHRLEHAVLQAGVRAHSDWSAALALGWHAGDTAHTEAAWLQWQGLPAQRWRLGRQDVARGDVITGAGHLDRFSQMPLAVRAVFDGPWQDDGLQVQWRPDAPGLTALDVGLWRHAVYPGSPPSAPSWHVHPQWQWGHDLRTDAFISHGQVRERGQHLGATTGAHSHSAPDCGASLVQLACFDGTVTMAGASAAWSPDDGPWTVQGAWLWRQDQGSLSTSTASVQQRARYQGAWLDVVWAFRPDWQSALRIERLAPQHTLDGLSATLVARETGLIDSASSQRISAMVGWQWQPDLQLSAEASREQLGSAAPRNAVALRLRWQGSLTR